MTTDAAVRPRRVELAGFLKARRARLSPEEVGLPPAPRRRTPGLRREEVAMLAGVGVTWYTWLEQGRPINASGQVLDAVARTLRLDRAEREHLYRLAEATPLRAGAGTTAVSDVVRDVLHGLDPIPATLINSRFDIVESNAAHVALFAHWHSLPCVHKNLLWCCVTEPRAREWFPDYEREVPHLVARLREAYGRHVGDPSWEEDLRRLHETSPEFAEMWARHEVAEPRDRVLRFRHPVAGDLTFNRTELSFPSAAGLAVAVYPPRDESTRDRLRLTRPAG
ncbi:helix-turn-helix transcriptional regulator [Actinoallomurus iriomotensis]|uniref:Transcriptional regulator n=1 Tax=Actinoallomurus iriomotensis TaxID=478107 RepID=A0A9W6SBI7_9ACTN|nr:helix-turn-helix transcriptional regulator [Actinoallomurus iriomotensis]GLY89507.1 transcriptional regulator [Actinoallomurus iriomotensis]